MSESGEEFDPPTVQGARRGPGWGWIWKALLVLATSAVAAWGALYVAVNSEGVRSRLGDEARAALARSAPTATLGNEVESDLWGRVRLGPLWVSGESPSGTWLYADAVEVRPSYRSLLKGRPRVAAVTVHGARLARSVSQRDVRAALPRRLAGADPQTRSSASGTLRLLFPDFTFGCQRLPPPGARSDETCAEGPIRASVTVDRTDAGRRIGAELTLPGGGRGDLQVRTLSGWAEIEGRIEGASASEMARWSPSLPVRVTAGRVDLTFRAQSPSPDASLGEAHL
ncbi:MAG TPA: hypothetical protein VEY30_03990, partial [Myxococcaceae bacterium]|nr:hypothetical protein [Myxococcaceae bacterium]